MIESEQKPAHWKSTRRLMAIVVAAIGAASLSLALFGDALGAIVVYGFPVSFYLVAQALPIICVIAAFWFAGRQEAIDRRHGAMEDM